MDNVYTKRLHFLRKRVKRSRVWVDSLQGVLAQEQKLIMDDKNEIKDLLEKRRQS